MMSEPDAITRLYQACDPSESLKPGDPRYVDLDKVRGENLAKLFERSLRRSAPHQYEFKLFAGHRGVGKTSELLRLKKNLESAENGTPFQVVFFDVSDSLDTNDLDFPDLLVFTAAQLQVQLKEANIPGFKSWNAYLERVWDDLKGLLGSEVQLDEGKIGVGFAELALSLRNRPNARAMLRDKIEMQSSTLLKGVNDLLSDATAALRQSGKAGIVLIIDGLDKLVRRPLDDGKSNTHDRLFIDRREQLASLRAHIVYTVPISLYYSPRCAQLEQTFGEFNVPVPMISLRSLEDPKIDPESPGMKKLREIIVARCKVAGVSFGEAFKTKAVSDTLCKISGGHPRNLMILIQSTLNELDELPITAAAVKKAIKKYANSLLREIQDESWAPLRKFDKPQTRIPTDDLHQEMLFLLQVFEYMNGEPWYEINPIIREIKRFKQA